MCVPFMYHNYEDFCHQVAEIEKKKNMWAEECIVYKRRHQWILFLTIAKLKRCHTAITSTEDSAKKADHILKEIGVLLRNLQNWQELKTLVEVSFMKD